MVTDLKHRVFPFEALIFLLLMTVTARVLADGSIIDLIYSVIVGIIAASIFYYLFYKKINGYIANEKHSYDYVKFILIVSTLFPIMDFLLYFSVIVIIFSSIIVFDAVNRKRNIGYGFCVIVPFLWLILN